MKKTTAWLPDGGAAADLRELAARHALGLIVLFGSSARGAARPGSDADIGVLRADGRRLRYRELAAVFSELAAAVEPRIGRPLDLADLATDDAIFRREVARDGQVLFEDVDGRWVEFVTHALIDYADIEPWIQPCIDGVARAARS